jgi:hybrid cluster-associated redox disulfide protein
MGSGEEGKFMVSAPQITKDMKIDEVIKRYPKTIETFERFGLRCSSCSVSAFEYIEEGARSHGIDIDILLHELNRVAQE